MPVYNNSAYIEEAINSAIKQKFKKWNMLISDDRSTDGTVNLLKKIKHKNIKIYYQKKNLGIYGNLKFLNSKAKSSIVKILCADDKLLPNALQNIFLFMEKNKSCKICTCYDQKTKKIFTKYNLSLLGNKYFTKFNPKSSMFALLVFGNIFGSLSRVAYKRKNFNISSTFDRSISSAGDYYAWSKMSKKYGFFLIKKKLVYIRSHSGQATYFLNRKYDLYIQYAYVLNFLIKNIDPSYHKALKKYLLQFNLPQRITNYLRCLVNLRFDLAKKIFANLPFGISVMEIFFNYFHYLLVHKSLIRCDNEYIIKDIQKLNA